MSAVTDAVDHLVAEALDVATPAALADDCGPLVEAAASLLRVLDDDVVDALWMELGGPELDDVAAEGEVYLTAISIALETRALDVIRALG
jgi:hypothetical protein